MAWIAGIPPAVLAGAAVIVYVYLLAGRWQAPMLLDVALGALYLWRPSLGLYTFVCAVIIVRWSRPLATEVAVLFKLYEYPGLTRSVSLFCLPALTHMSSTAVVAPKTPDMQVVYRPVEQTGMEEKAVEDYVAPRVSPYLDEDEFIVFLATQKLRNGKYRMSGNDIVKAAKGDRNHVLAVVREVREPSDPVFPPLSPEQEQERAALGLGRAGQP